MYSSVVNFVKESCKRKWKKVFKKGKKKMVMQQKANSSSEDLRLVCKCVL